MSLIGAVAEISPQPFKALRDGADVLAGDAFVEHGVGQHRQTRGVAVLAAAGGEDQAHVEHRQFMGLDEQHLGAFGGVPGLHVEFAAGRGFAVEFGQRLQLSGWSWPYPALRLASVLRRASGHTPQSR